MFSRTYHFLTSMMTSPSKARWSIIKSLIAFCGFSLVSAASLLAYTIVDEPPPSRLSLKSVRLLNAPGTTRVDAEKIMGTELLAQMDRPDLNQRANPSVSFDTPRFRPSEVYAIRWSSSSSHGYWIRVYFDKNDHVKAVEGSMADEPPPLAERLLHKLRSLTQ